MDNERQGFCGGNDEKHRETIMCDRILKENIFGEASAEARKRRK